MGEVGGWVGAVFLEAILNSQGRAIFHRSNCPGWGQSSTGAIVRTPRRSCLQMFFKIGVLKNYIIFTQKHLCWDLFLRKLQRDSNTGVFQ